MKKSIKTFAYAAAASMMLLACNTADDSELSSQAAGDDLSKATSSPPEMECTDDIPITSCYPINDPSANQPPELLPPYPVTIEKDVKKWMEEQLASGSSEKRLILISDGYIADTQPPGLSAFGRSDSNGEYFVEYSLNGKKISAEEYYRIQEEYRSQINTGKRNLSIPGEIKYEDSRSWTVLITAKELAEAELPKKYNDLVISFYREPQNG